MKKFHILCILPLLLIGLCAAVPSATAAPAAGPMDFSTLGLAFSGAWWDLGTFGDSFGGNAAVWWAPLPHLGLQLRTGYFDKTKTNLRDFNARGKVRLIPLEFAVTGILPLHDHFRLFAGGGLGWYAFSGEIKADNRPELSLDVDDTLGFFGFGGFILEFTEQLWLLGEVRYTHLDSDLKISSNGIVAKKYSPDISGAGANIGLVFGF